jgi:glycosyltransferase involved in cell wall biosynthesis
MSQPLIVACSLGFHEQWQKLCTSVTGGQARWNFYNDQPVWFMERAIRRPNLGLIRASLQAALCVARRNASLLISVGPRTALWCGLFCRLFHVHVNHYVDVFNFTDLPVGVRRRLMRYAFRQVTRFTVHSRMEIDLYSRYFDIPKDRIRLRLWGIGTPEVFPEFPLEPGRYVSSIGGNGRDYRTFIEASRSLPAIPFVLVVRPDSLKGLEIPKNVKVFVNMPFAEAMNILLHSVFTVLPLNGEQRATGHVTLVCAMHLAKAVVATDSAGISDYVRPGYNGVCCEASSAGKLSQAIAQLWDDPAEVARLAENNRRFGDEHCREEHTRADLAEVLSASGIPLQQETILAANALSE